MKAELNDPLHVVANTLNVNVEYMPGVLKEECNKHKEHSQDEADLAKAANSNFQTANHWGCGTCSDTPDNDDLITGCDFNPVPKTVKASIHLYNTQSKAGADAEHGADHGKYVYCVTHPAKDLFADEGIETRTHGHGKTLPEPNKCK